MKCVIICASPEMDFDFIRSQIMPDDFVICADNGYLVAKKTDIKVDLLIGDFDSYKGAMPEKIKTITLPVHKDDTDTQFCAKTAVEMGYKEIVFLNAIGGRHDHTFANIATLFYLLKRGIKASIISKDECIMPLDEGVYSFALKGKTFSLFPFGVNEISINYKGCEYEGEDIVIKYDSSLGISNVFTEDKSTIEVIKGNALIFINENV